jgi:hypothetical protein
MCSFHVSSLDRGSTISTVDAPEMQKGAEMKELVANNQVIVFEGAGHGMRTGGHGGEYLAGYFTAQFDWLQTLGVLQV